MKIPYSKVESVFEEWCAKAIMPGFPLHIQILAGLRVPQIRKMIHDELVNQELLVDGCIDTENLKEALNFNFKFRDELQSDYAGVTVRITKEHIRELMNALEN